MGVAEELETLRADVPGCAVIAFADLQTRIVLVSSSEGAARRETLDSLCAGAVALFEAAARAGEPEADIALRSHGGMTEIALRDSERMDEALCAICTPGTDVSAYLARAREVLHAIVREGGA